MMARRQGKNSKVGASGQPFFGLGRRVGIGLYGSR